MRNTEKQKIEIYPDRAQYLKGEEVLIAVRVEKKELPVGAKLKVLSLDRTIMEKRVNAEASGSFRNSPCQSEILISLGIFEETFAGYRVLLMEGGEIIARTAFDVTVSHSDYIRYGFLSDFTAEDGKTEEDILFLNKMHINYVQFYDWSYRPDQYITEEDVYEDLMHKLICRDTVLQKISRASEYHMVPMAYGAVYAASEAFYKKHKKWALYGRNGEVLKFINTFYYMNIAPGCPWRSHIMKEYCKAVSLYGFRGIHMDTYGFPKRAWGYKEPQNETEHKLLLKMENAFAALIRDTRKVLDNQEQDCTLIFNNVGSWPVDKTAGEPQDAVYIEVWPPFERYHHLRELIREARSCSRGTKQIILAAYLAPFRTDTPERALRAAVILTAATASLGASNILFGEQQGILTQGYYADYSRLDEYQSEVLRMYYDFQIGYMKLLQDRQMEDVTSVFAGGDNAEYIPGFEDWSMDGEADRIWITLREADNVRVISMINLCGCGDDRWNSGKEQPFFRKNLKWSILAECDVTGVFLDSPDQNNEEMISLQYHYRETEKGRYLDFTVPSLEIWDLIYIRIKQEEKG